MLWARSPQRNLGEWDIGDILGAEGTLFKTKTGEPSDEGRR